MFTVITLSTLHCLIPPLHTSLVTGLAFALYLFPFYSPIHAASLNLSHLPPVCTPPHAHPFRTEYTYWVSIATAELDTLSLWSCAMSVRPSVHPFVRPLLRCPSFPPSGSVPPTDTLSLAFASSALFSVSYSLPSSSAECIQALNAAYGYEPRDLRPQSNEISSSYLQRFCLPAFHRRLHLYQSSSLQCISSLIVYPHTPPIRPYPLPLFIPFAISSFPL